MQVESAKSHLQGKQRAFEELPNIHERRGKVCAICHTSGHNRTNCKKMPCNDVNTCKLKDKHSELLADIRTLQRELKEIEQKFAKAKSDHDVFAASRQRAKSSFFAIMRPRLRKQNPAKYVDRSALDRDLMILQRALKNKVPLEETHVFSFIPTSNDIITSADILALFILFTCDCSKFHPCHKATISL